WTLSGGLPSLQPVARQITQAAPHRLVFDARGLGRWDSTLISFAYELAELAKERGIDLEVSGLPPGAQKLLAIATAVPPRSLARPSPTRSRRGWAAWPCGPPAPPATPSASSARPCSPSSTSCAAEPASAPSTCCTPSKPPGSPPSASWPSSTS